MDLNGKLGDPARVDASLGDLARGVIGSEILRIAAEIRALKMSGEGLEICNLTVGDFDPAQFPAPPALLDGMRAALAAGQTNYPPSDGVVGLREAVARFYAKHLGLSYPVESVLITGGARPLLYGSYRTVLDPGDAVVYPVPSWNNNHYVHITGATGVPVVCGPDTQFLPTRELLEPAIAGARLLALCSPLNPTGTLFDAEQLSGICDLVLEENARRGPGEKPLYLLFDQIYWTLTFGAARHHTPVELRPQMARYTVFIDGVSKAFAATGVRVGWGVGPPDVIEKMAGLLGHVGAWAPRPEQVAMAALLDDEPAVTAYLGEMRARVQQRLDRLAAGFAALRADGYPVEAIAPQGAIYLSVRVAIPHQSNEATRQLLLTRAGLAVVPFQAFGLREDSGWFRISVGAVSLAEIDAAFPRLRAALPRR